VIILDESRLTNGTLLMIGQDYEMLESPIDIENYDRNVEAVVNRFKFDLDEFKEKLVNIIKDNLKVELRLKS
jgi:hypothetical protein